MWNDPIVEELHKNRQEMATKFNDDIYALCNYYRERQQQESTPVVSLPPRLLKKLSSELKN